MKHAKRIEKLEQRTQPEQRAQPVRFSHELIQALIEHRTPRGYTDAELKAIERARVFDSRICENLLGKIRDEQPKQTD